MRYLLWLLLPLFTILITVIAGSRFWLADKILHVFIGSNPFHEVLPTGSRRKPHRGRKAQLCRRKKRAYLVKYIHITKQQNPKFLPMANADANAQEEAQTPSSYVYIALIATTDSAGRLTANRDLLLRIGRFPRLRGKAIAVGRPVTASDHDPVWRFLLPDRYLTNSTDWHLYTIKLQRKTKAKDRMSSRIAKIHLNPFLEEI